jgi:hypothetical protein
MPVRPVHHSLWPEEAQPKEFVGKSIGLPGVERIAPIKTATATSPTVRMSPKKGITLAKQNRTARQARRFRRGAVAENPLSTLFMDFFLR